MEKITKVAVRQSDKWLASPLENGGEAKKKKFKSSHCKIPGSKSESNNLLDSQMMAQYKLYHYAAYKISIANLQARGTDTCLKVRPQ